MQEGQPPKAGPPTKPPKLTSGGTFQAISEELISLSERFEHFHSNVDRVPNTVELSDFQKCGVEMLLHGCCIGSRRSGTDSWRR
eukprot:10546219-Karenia_brevis.AAC.1